MGLWSMNAMWKRSGECDWCMICFFLKGFRFWATIQHISTYCKDETRSWCSLGTHFACYSSMVLVLVVLMGFHVWACVGLPSIGFHCSIMVLKACSWPSSLQSKQLQRLNPRWVHCSLRVLLFACYVICRLGRFMSSCKTWGVEACFINTYFENVGTCKTWV
jgi:hypothetical protein